MKTYNIHWASGSETLIRLEDFYFLYYSPTSDYVARCHKDEKGIPRGWQEWHGKYPKSWIDIAYHSINHLLELRPLGEVEKVVPIENGVYYSIESPDLLYRRINGKWYYLRQYEGVSPCWVLYSYSDSRFPVSEVIKIPKSSNSSPLDLEYNESTKSIKSPIQTPWQHNKSEVLTENVEPFKVTETVGTETITPNIPKGATVLGGPAPWANR